MGRPLALETPEPELAGALESLHALPNEHAQRSLLALAERARRPAGKAPATSARRSQKSRRQGFA